MFVGAGVYTVRLSVVHKPLLVACEFDVADGLDVSRVTSHELRQGLTLISVVPLDYFPRDREGIYWAGLVQIGWEI